jgi:hypothetical protein
MASPLLRTVGSIRGSSLYRSFIRQCVVHNVREEALSRSGGQPMYRDMSSQSDGSQVICTVAPGWSVLLPGPVAQSGCEQREVVEASCDMYQYKGPKHTERYGTKGSRKKREIVIGYRGLRDLFPKHTAAIGPMEVAKPERDQMIEVAKFKSHEGGQMVLSFETRNSTNGTDGKPAVLRSCCRTPAGMIQGLGATDGDKVRH